MFLRKAVSLSLIAALSGAPLAGCSSSPQSRSAGVKSVKNDLRVSP
jgi:hypothetical protein